MFSMCSELTPRARIPDTRIPQLMQPCADDYGCKNGGDEAKTLSAKEATSGKIFLLKKLKEQTHKGKTSPDRKIK